MKILECVPNFSEGQNRRTIDAIAEALQLASLADAAPAILQGEI